MVGRTFRLVTNTSNGGLAELVGRSLVSWLMDAELRLMVSWGLSTERTLPNLGLLKVISEFASLGFSRASGLGDSEPRSLISRLTRSFWCSVSEMRCFVAGLNRSFRSLNTTGTDRLMNSSLVSLFAPFGLNSGGSSQASDSKSSDGLH